LPNNAISTYLKIDQEYDFPADASPDRPAKVKFYRLHNHTINTEGESRLEGHTAGISIFPLCKVTVVYLCAAMTIKVQIVNKSTHPLPEYQTAGAAGMDLRAWLTETVVLQPMERRLIPTGLYLALTEGFEAQIRPRSGMAIKKGITLVNTPGTIDADYRGEIMIPVINLSTEPQEIQDGERIAQMIVARHERVEWQPEETLSSTERGEGGFGHSGIH
jgi:dUTP pyrophosphatase